MKVKVVEHWTELAPSTKAVNTFMTVTLGGFARPKLAPNPYKVEVNLVNSCSGGMELPVRSNKLLKPTHFLRMAGNNVCHEGSCM